MPTVDFSIIKSAVFPETPTANTLYISKDPNNPHGIVIGVTDDGTNGDPVIRKTNSVNTGTYQGFTVTTPDEVVTVDLDNDVQLKFKLLEITGPANKFDCTISVSQSVLVGYRFKTFNETGGSTITSNPEIDTISSAVTETVSAELKGWMAGDLEGTVSNYDTGINYLIRAYGGSDNRLFINVDTYSKV